MQAAPPASSGTQTKHNLVDPAVYDKISTEEDKKPLTIKLRKPGVKQTKPGNWKESEVLDPSRKKQSSPPPKPPSPIVNPLSPSLAPAFSTSRPMEDAPDTVQCKHCRRPVLRVKAPEHIKSCLSKKQEKLKKKKEAKEAKDAALRRERGEGASQAGDDNDISTSKGGARKSALKGSEAGADDERALTKKAGKKRKAEGEPGDKAVKTKKKKEEPKAKAAKPKGPVDVEKQCGVPLPNGAQCARSLTCKSHSMGAKRAVPGRSLPYDMLLAQYQKKNQAKQQRAAIDANAPLPDDFDTHGPVDSDEEKEAIMAAIARARPQPLVTKHPIATKSKYQYVRMKEMLHSALRGGGGVGNLFSVPNGFAAGNGDGGGGLPHRGLLAGEGDVGFSSPAEGGPQPGVFEVHPHARRQSVIMTGGSRQVVGQMAAPARKGSAGGVGVVA
ncbi:hypothetical protein W97_03692 [Coniosporium apollinis CBS 100218]|uniref:SCA7 domain-containing protein n=1 Tax=Coniosporium apollinis (strain CBS 100218) TaxID=1168221 RepID=R7YRB3_CONA1|nr:uncharacterized protein W97_03692 [Coniosporium apollinis CBS 100218]EON64460.1 hypothetical protein W97_03692 [Coniosporium apollinis CBS 100218]